jgi:type IV secretion system protein VirB4
MGLFSKKQNTTDEDEDENNVQGTAAGAKKANTTVPVTTRFDFIPYHSHYNAHTLLTKNGELLQTIRINGNHVWQNCENLDSLHMTIRDALRASIMSGMNSEDFSFWLHVIRRRNPLSYHADFPEGLAGYVNTQWEKFHQFTSLYHNEVYLTVLHDGQDAPLIDSANSRHVIFPQTNKRWRNQYLDNAYKKLDTVVMNMVGSLREHCNANRLALVERPLPNSGMAMRQPAANGTIFYSEPMEFLGNLVNLRDETFPLPDVDLSAGLETSHLTFGFNAIEARSDKTNVRRYSSILSLKHYCEMHVETVDVMMQAPLEMIISQSFKFTPANKALKQVREQKELFELSGDVASKDVFGINEMLSSHHKKPTDFGEQQTTIMIMADNGEELDKQVSMFQHAINKVGLIAVREDVKMEECFWSQMPGNFNFIRRKDMLATDKVAGMCRLNRFPTGSMQNNHWGACISMIPTMVDSPYFFNFHARDNGHTVVFDYNSFDDRMGKQLIHFLMMQAQKFNPRIVIFDRDQSARLLSAKLGGSYYTFQQLEKVTREFTSDGKPQLAFNPFSLEDSRHNQYFLAAWCGLLIQGDAPLDNAVRDVLRQVVGELYALPPQDRHLPNMARLLAKYDPALAEGLAPWYGDGKHAKLFDFAEDGLDVSPSLLSFDLTPALQDPAYTLPIFSYLMHRVIGSLDGRPTIIVMHEAWSLLENSFFAPRLDSLMEMLRQQNVMLLATTQKPMNCQGTATLKSFMTCGATQLYLPDDVPLSYPSTELHLGGEEALLLLNMDRQKGDFLVKQGGDTVALRANLLDMEDALAIFTNDVKFVSAAHGPFSGVPKDY